MSSNPRRMGKGENSSGAGNLLGTFASLLKPLPNHSAVSSMPWLPWLTLVQYSIQSYWRNSAKCNFMTQIQMVHKQLHWWLWLYPGLRAPPRLMDIWGPRWKSWPILSVGFEKFGLEGMCYSTSLLRRQKEDTAPLATWSQFLQSSDLRH